jgi:hypothetical protein
MRLLQHLEEAYDIEPRERLMLQSLMLRPPLDGECFSRWLADADFDALDALAVRLVPALSSSSLTQ